MTDGGDRKKKKAKDGPTRIKVEDRRHWARQDREEEPEGNGAEPAAPLPTVVEQYRQRAEEAEARLQEYIEAFKEARSEQEKVRQRLERDVERKSDMRFAGLLEELLECMDDLDRAVDHAGSSPEVEPLARGVTLVRDRFLAAVQKSGVDPIRIDGEPFDPNLAEATRVDPVDDPGREGTVTETIRPGYRLGDLVIRPASVAVGKLLKS